MRRSPRALIAAVAAVALFAVACGDDGSSEQAAGAPDFTAPTLDGAELSSAEFDGPTVLWFWAPWCTVCRAEAPNVVAAADQLGDDVRVIGVAGRGEVDAMNGFVDDTGVGPLTHAVDDDGSIWAAYGVTSQPAFAFIDGDGELTDVVIGAMGEDGLVEQARALAG